MRRADPPRKNRRNAKPYFRINPTKKLFNPFKRRMDMKVTEVISVLRLYQIDVLLLGLIERILDALTKKLTELKDLVSLEAERLKSKRK
jgi:hypothetical protein